MGTFFPTTFLEIAVNVKHASVFLLCCFQGSPGLPGRNGVNGHNGLPGRDGRDGAKRENCVVGPPGPRSERNGTKRKIEQPLITETGNSARGRTATVVTRVKDQKTCLQAIIQIASYVLPKRRC